MPEPGPLAPKREPVAGDSVVVVMLDGQRLEGLLVEQDQFSVTVKIAGVAARIDRDDVERLYVQESPAQRYKRMRAMIPDTDTERLVLLCQWLQAHRLYSDALVELDHVLVIEPANGEAIRLKALVLELRALETRSAEGPDPREQERNREVARRFPTRPSPSEFPSLSDEQINLLKVFEVDLRDPPRMIIQREVVERLLTQYADSPLIPGDREGRDAFLRMPADRILDVMFQIRAREFYGQVQVSEQPRSMKMFRDHVHSAWLINSCATTRCHGGSAAGRLQLTNWKPTSDRSVYTNFLILDRSRTRDGKPLIDYEEPERSALLQMGLPREDARTPHPQVPGWTPVFRSRDSRRFTQAMEWIGAMYRPRPEYPIEYVPPGERDPVAAPGQAPPPKDPVER